MKPVLMIHEFREEMLALPLEDYVLTFDDGLFSQYYYFDRIKHLKTEKIFFISTNIVCDPDTVQSMGFPPCHEAHEKAFDGNREDYMTLEQIRELAQDPMVRIGGHSHYHKNVGQMHKLFDQVRHIDEDTKLMVEWFKTNLGKAPIDYCFPYNQDMSGNYKLFLSKYNFLNFYGRERLAIEELLWQSISQ